MSDPQDTDDPLTAEDPLTDGTDATDPETDFKSASSRPGQKGGGGGAGSLGLWEGSASLGSSSSSFNHAGAPLHVHNHPKPRHTHLRSDGGPPLIDPRAPEPLSASATASHSPDPSPPTSPGSHHPDPQNFPAQSVPGVSPTTRQAAGLALNTNTLSSSSGTLAPFPPVAGESSSLHSATAGSSSFANLAGFSSPHSYHSAPPSAEASDSTPRAHPLSRKRALATSTSGLSQREAGPGGGGGNISTLGFGFPRENDSFGGTQHVPLAHGSAVRSRPIPTRPQPQRSSTRGGLGSALGVGRETNGGSSSDELDEGGGGGGGPAGSGSGGFADGGSAGVGGVGGAGIGRRAAAAAGAHPLQLRALSPSGGEAAVSLLQDSVASMAGLASRGALSSLHPPQPQRDADSLSMRGGGTSRSDPPVKRLHRGASRSRSLGGARSSARSVVGTGGNAAGAGRQQPASDASAGSRAEVTTDASSSSSSGGGGGGGECGRGWGGVEVLGVRSHSDTDGGDGAAAGGRGRGEVEALRACTPGQPADLQGGSVSFCVYMCVFACLSLSLSLTHTHTHIHTHTLAARAL
jgi:hypothetical protein